MKPGGEDPPEDRPARRRGGDSGGARLSCPVCLGSDARVELHWSRGFDICRCPECGSLFADPLPSQHDLDAFYQGFLYRKPHPRDIERGVRARRAELESLFGAGQKTERVPRFLDHGGGTGAAFAAARQLGWDSHFSELDGQARAFVRETFGLDEGHDASDPSRFGERFDFIFSDNVIEHVIDPAALLRDLVAALSPGGTLVVKTPSAAATEHYFYPMTLRSYLRTAWQHNSPGAVARMAAIRPIWYCDPPRHLYSFSAAGLSAMARRIGLREGSFRTTLYGTPPLANTVTRLVFGRPRGLKSAVTRALALPIVPFELATKPVQKLSLALGVISPGGLMLRVDKPRR